LFYRAFYQIRSRYGLTHPRRDHPAEGFIAQVPAQNLEAVKPTNKAGRPAAEPVEPRVGTEGNAGQRNTHRAQDRARVSQALDRVRQAARQRKKERFTALLHHVDIACLREAFHALKRNAAPGADGVTCAAREADLERTLQDLHDPVHRGAYRAQPSRRVYIPKADGRQRPLAVASLEDKTHSWPWPCVAFD